MKINNHNVKIFKIKTSEDKKTKNSEWLHLDL